MWRDKRRHLKTIKASRNKTSKNKIELEWNKNEIRKCEKGDKGKWKKIKRRLEGS